MKQLVLIIFVLFVVAVIIVVNLPPKAITLDEISQSMVPRFENSDTIKTTLVNNREIVSHDEAVVDYYIIVQSLSKLEQAQEKAKKFKKSFGNDFIVLPPTPDGYYRISCGKYPTREDATSKLKSVRDLMGNEVWVLSVKK